jgi:hypothetical protein
MRMNDVYRSGNSAKAAQNLGIEGLMLITDDYRHAMCLKRASKALRTVDAEDGNLVSMRCLSDCQVGNDALKSPDFKGIHYVSYSEPLIHA